VLSMIPYTLVRDWYGGDAWGPRFLIPVLPLMLLPLSELPPLLARHPLRAVLAALVTCTGLVIALNRPTRVVILNACALPLRQGQVTVFCGIRGSHLLAITSPPYGAI